MKVNSNRKVYIYIASVTIAYLELVDVYFQAAVIESNNSLRYCKYLVAFLFAVIEFVTAHAIVRGGIIRTWRAFMARKVGIYILTVVFLAAFTALMTVVCNYLDNSYDRIRVIVASSVIAIPNMLALLWIGISSSKKDQ